MMRLRWIGLLGLFGLVLVGCGSQPAEIIVSGVTYDTEQIAQGQQIYAQSCASCHGPNGEDSFLMRQISPTLLDVSVLHLTMATVIPGITEMRCSFAIPVKGESA